MCTLVSVFINFTIPPYRLSDFLDRKVYSNVYGMSLAASARSPNTEEGSRNTSTGISAALGGRRTESVPTQYSDVTQTYAEPHNYYSNERLAATAPNTTETPRVYESVAYTLSSTCLGQDSGIADHVYAVLEEPIDDNN